MPTAPWCPRLVGVDDHDKAHPYVKYHNDTAPTAHTVHRRLAQLSCVRRTQLTAVPMAGTQGENGPRKACHAPKQTESDNNNNNTNTNNINAAETGFGAAKSAKHREVS